MTASAPSGTAPTLTAVVVAHNEEANLDECLAGLAFADEILVVLDRCTDRSAEIARRYTDRVVEGGWEREGDRRNHAAGLAGGDWILDVDADERISPSLAREIRETIVTSVHDRHAIPFDNWVGGRLIRHGWGATVGISSKTILFRKGTRRVGPERVHPRVRFDGRQGPPLMGRVRHLIYRDASDLIHRLDRYSSLRALDLRDSGAKETLWRNIGRFFARFYKCYVRRGGRREGH